MSTDNENLTIEVANADKPAVEKAVRTLADGRADLERMYAELKTELKTMSKNQLIKMVGACLIDNYVLKTQLESLANGVSNAQNNPAAANVTGNDILGTGGSTSTAERAAAPEQS